jgi:hypothetical protein
MKNNTTDTNPVPSPAPVPDPIMPRDRINTPLIVTVIIVLAGTGALLLWLMNTR